MYKIIDEIIELLKQDGINSKQKAINILKSIKDGEQDDPISS